MSGISVEVTQEDITEGKPERNEECPTALAIKRATAGAHVYVQTYVAFVDGVIYNLPEEATLFIADFDSQRTVEPFSFVMQEHRLDEGATKTTEKEWRECLLATIRATLAGLTHEEYQEIIEEAYLKLHSKDALPT